MVRFKSKIDSWFKVVHWGTVLLMVVVATALLITDTGETPVVVKVLLLVIIGIVAWVMLAGYYQTDYTFENDTLKVRYGLMKWRVPLARIERVYPSRSMWSGPALSLDRLAIKQLGSRLELYISPEEKTEFLDALVRSTEGLELKGEEVIRSA